MFLKYLTIPFKKRGRSFDGADCYGMLMLFFQHELGIHVKDFLVTGLPVDADAETCLSAKEEEWLEVPLDALRPWDVLAMANQSDTPNHTGVVLDGGTFLHTLEGVGPAVSRLSTWAPKIRAAYRHRRLVE